MIDRRLADLVVVVHLAYLAFLPAGAVLVTRRPHLAPLHLGAVAVAVTSVTVGFDCPLTIWEQTLRRWGGQHPYRGGFVNHYLTETAFPPGADRVAQAAVAVLIAGAYVRLARSRSDAPDSLSVDRHRSLVDAVSGRDGRGRRSGRRRLGLKGRSFPVAQDCGLTLGPEDSGDAEHRS